jgi:hypothetical protein
MTEAEQIYYIFPRKIAKRAAITSIEKAIRRLEYGEWDNTPLSRQDAATFLFCATAKYSQSPAGNNGTFTPHPTTWFNQARYLDAQQEWYKQPEPDSLERRNNAALAGVFGTLPNEDRTAILENSNGNGRPSLEGISHPLLAESSGMGVRSVAAQWPLFPKTKGNH